MRLAVEATTKPQPHPKKLPPLVLLAKDETGYRNLMKLSSRAYLQTPESELPHATWEMLEELSGGLICLSGGPDGPIDEALVQGQEPLARQLAERLKGLFGDRFYIELQRHGTEAERAAEVGSWLISPMNWKCRLVATNQVYFAKPDDYAAHDALICIAEGQVVSTEDRRRVTPEHYFKSQQEMAALFADIPEAIENTIEIAKRCAYIVKGPCADPAPLQ